MFTPETQGIPQIHVAAAALESGLGALVEEIASQTTKRPLVQLLFDESQYLGWRFISAPYATPEGMLSGDQILARRLQETGSSAGICSLQSSDYPGKLAIYAVRRDYSPKQWELESLMQRTTSRVPPHMTEQ